MKWLAELIRPDLRDFVAYRSARAEAASGSAVALDANECPWPPFGARAAEDNYNRYPEPQSPRLRDRLADVYGVKAPQIALGRGSDEGIDALVRLLCRPGEDQVLVCPPTFGMYAVAANLQGVETLRVPLCADGQLDVPAVLRACTARTKLIFIPSPNAPMGHLMKREDILTLCGARMERSLVVVDEAYVEFSDAPQGVLPYLAAVPNLVVLRTLSKAHALAGERVGCVIAAPQIIRNLTRILAPYPLAQSSIRAALDALSAPGLLRSREHRRVLVSERRRMAGLLAESAVVEQVYPSDANFLLLRTSDAQAVMNRLQSFGIRGRDRGADLPNTIRLTIGAPRENDYVLACFGVARTPSATGRPGRMFSVSRATRETAVDVTVSLDSQEVLEAETGIGFFDHMLSQLASHGGFGLALRCRGDLEVDQHHSIEDCAIALGEAISAALGDKSGIDRFGFTTPLDEALAEAVIDLSGRPYLALTGAFPGETVGGMSCEMVPHFFRSFAVALKATLHLKVTGENTHHMVEACFKATGRALRQAFRREGLTVPSTKGVL